jgi:hypothetical protein
MVDGLSIREDELTAALWAGPGAGAAVRRLGRGRDPVRRHLRLAGRPVPAGLGGAALVRTACKVRVFSLNHLVPTEQRMVVTGADPARRVVHQINAEPAAQEYARFWARTRRS